MTHCPQRRRLLQSAAALSAFGMLGDVAFSQSRSIAATSFPGSWEQVFRTIVIPEFQKSTGATVNLVAQNPVETVSKVCKSIRKK